MVQIGLIANVILNVVGSVMALRGRKDTISAPIAEIIGHVGELTKVIADMNQRQTPMTKEEWDTVSAAMHKAIALAQAAEAENEQ